MSSKIFTKKIVLIVLFTVLYSLSAFVSGFHAIEFFSLANPYWLALLLAITFEIGQAAVLFYLLQTKRKFNVKDFGSYGPWILMLVLTITQCMGNIYSSHMYMVQHNTENIQYFTDSVLFFIKDPDPKVNVVFIDYIVGFLLPIVALAMTSMVVEISEDKSIVVKGNNESEEVKEEEVKIQEEPKIEENIQELIENKEVELPAEEPIQKPVTASPKKYLYIKE